MSRTIAIVLALALVLTGCSRESQQTLTKDGLDLTLATEPTPPLAGRPTTLQFELQRGGASVSEAEVSFTRGMPGMEHPGDHTSILAHPAGNGRYAAQTDFVMGGRWEVTAAVRVANAQRVVMIFPVDVEQP